MQLLLLQADCTSILFLKLLGAYEPGQAFLCFRVPQNCSLVLKRSQKWIQVLLPVTLGILKNLLWCFSLVKSPSKTCIWCVPISTSLLLDKKLTAFLPFAKQTTKNYWNIPQAWETFTTVTAGCFSFVRPNCSRLMCGHSEVGGVHSMTASCVAWWFLTFKLSKQQ